MSSLYIVVMATSSALAIHCLLSVLTLPNLLSANLPCSNLVFTTVRWSSPKLSICWLCLFQESHVLSLGPAPLLVKVFSPLKKDHSNFFPEGHRRSWNAEIKSGNNASVGCACPGLSFTWFAAPMCPSVPPRKVDWALNNLMAGCQTLLDKRWYNL